MVAEQLSVHPFQQQPGHIPLFALYLRQGLKRLLGGIPLLCGQLP